MDLNELAIDLGKKLEVGDRQKIVDITGINKNTVYAILQGKTIRKMGKEKVMQVVNEAIDIIRSREGAIQAIIDKAEGL